LGRIRKQNAGVLNIGFYAIKEAAVYAAAEAPLKRFLYQHVDRAALDIHDQTTGTELKSQLRDLGRQGLSAAAFVGSIGTGGTLIGAAKHLRQGNPSLQVFATTPAEQPYADPNPPNGKTKFAGSGGFGFGRRQPFVSDSEGVINGHFSVSYHSALAASSEIADHAGIAIGTSGAANWLAARHVARDLPEDSAVVCILPSLMESNEIALAEEVRRGLSRKVDLDYSRVAAQLAADLKAASAAEDSRTQ
jgi:cysteine synthase A